MQPVLDFAPELRRLEAGLHHFVQRSPALFPGQAGGQGQVFVNGSRQRRRTAEHQPHPPPQSHHIAVRGQDIFPIQPDPTRHPDPDNEIAHPVQDPEEGAFAALGRPHEAKNLPGPDLQGQVVDDLGSAVKAGEVLDADFIRSLIVHIEIGSRRL